jgi:hypothetical protein
MSLMISATNVYVQVYQAPHSLIIFFAGSLIITRPTIMLREVGLIKQT